jgi:hypothetical protein
MFEFTAKDIRIGDEFTIDQGNSWWRANRVESRPGGRIWIEAMGLRSSAVSSETYDASDIFIVR